MMKLAIISHHSSLKDEFACPINDQGDDIGGGEEGKG
jgi:hypothetical protein